MIVSDNNQRADTSGLLAAPIHAAVPVFNRQPDGYVYHRDHLGGMADHNRVYALLIFGE